MKKPSGVSFLIITLMLAAAVCIQGQQPELVTDTNGNPVQLGEKYFIQPVTTNGGGLAPAPPTLGSICPLGVVQSLLPTEPGLPVSFTLPYALMEKFVKTSLAVNIEFQSDFWPFCKQFSKFWEVDASPSTEPSILVKGKPQEKNSWFKFEKAGEGANTYKITTLTGIVGTRPGFFNAPTLIIPKDNANTLLVKFRKVDDATTATTSTSRVEKLGLSMFPFY